MTLSLLALLQRAEPVMGTDSWVFMGLAWASVACLAVFCFWRVLGGGNKE